MNSIRPRVLFAGLFLGLCAVAFATARPYTPAPVEVKRPPVDVSQVFVPGDLPQADMPAFPGAEGGGKYSFGGRGGEAYVVTSLADSGQGTFREALEAEGPRIVIFNVAGIIELQSKVSIVHPYITIAGQTAPGDGVVVAGATVDIDTHDVVVRHMRFRRGLITAHNQRDGAMGTGNPVGNIIIDSCSFSWGLDENVSLYRYAYRAPGGDKLFIGPTKNLTIQWSISSEALDTHNHAFGGTWGGKNSSFHHNLFASNTARNPSIGMGFGFNYTNNVIFNWRHRTVDGGDHRSRVNVINNYYKPGPATLDGPERYRIGRVQPTPDRADNALRRWPKWYVRGNVVEGYPEITADNWSNGGMQFHDDPHRDEAFLVERVRSLDPFPMAGVTLHTAERAYDLVLAYAGATLPRRDSVDRRIIDEVRTGEVLYKEGNGIITEIAQVGGFPEYRGEPYQDSSGDGIPDWWKIRHGLDPHDPSDANLDMSGDGYSNLECFIYGLDPWKYTDWRDPANNVDTLRDPGNTLVRQR
ncbi:MAG: hypothetical protein JJU00_04390 [Opitutales bacterium]|nr:hypothetical protein [Opitutales bacterium]